MDGKASGALLGALTLSLFFAQRPNYRHLAVVHRLRRLSLVASWRLYQTCGRF